MQLKWKAGLKQSDQKGLNTDGIVKPTLTQCPDSVLAVWPRARGIGFPKPSFLKLLRALSILTWRHSYLSLYLTLNYSIFRRYHSSNPAWWPVFTTTQGSGFQLSLNLSQPPSGVQSVGVLEEMAGGTGQSLGSDSGSNSTAIFLLWGKRHWVRHKIWFPVHTLTKEGKGINTAGSLLHASTAECKILILNPDQVLLGSIYIPMW